MFPEKPYFLLHETEEHNKIFMMIKNKYSTFYDK